MSLLASAFSIVGSSPRVRGTRVRPRDPDAARRFIPACAGNSSARSPWPPASTVHPRVCGELGPWSAEASANAGSSPRVRGTLARRRRSTGRHRFIPACAGNSPIRAHAATSGTVHPRVCGELILRCQLDSSPVGSSPRVRGTLGAPRRRCRCRRFIPACAGNSWSCPRPPSPRPVHPRVCGELILRCQLDSSPVGSSPRVRGTRAPRAVSPPSRRFIPACAGNSRAAREVRRALPVHPRVCGELVNSPRGVCPARRFIPACAGNSTRCARKSPPKPVHPRVCGELVVQVAQGPAADRFIPACAGNS